MLPVHLRDDDVAKIDGYEAAMADVEKVGAEGGIAAPDDKNVILRLAIPVFEPTSQYQDILISNIKGQAEISRNLGPAF